MIKAPDTPRVWFLNIWTQLAQNFSNGSIISAGIIPYKESESINYNYSLDNRNNGLSNIFAAMRALYPSYTC
jgi:hypothetical protein